MIRKLLLSLAVTAFIATISCNKKSLVQQPSDSQGKYRNLSLELENSSHSVNKGNNTDISTVTSSLSTEPTIAPHEIKTMEHKSLEKTLKKEDFTSSKSASKVEKNQKLKRFEKMKTMIAKKSGLNQNIKIGIILLLVGLIVSYFVGYIGGIVSLVGLIFLVIGLLEIL
ncbi:MAG: hypothetical protein EAZ07_07770 [Cytophagales bacterium]|nr:MAG: hypothetical protein EAZ07_07770 [Cytophagales bacterium]